MYRYLFVFILQVYKQKLYGPKIVWFLIGWYPDNWYDADDKHINCTAEQLKEALQYHFTTEGMMLKPDDTPSISGMVSSSTPGPLGLFFIKFWGGVSQRSYVEPNSKLDLNIMESHL